MVNQPARVSCRRCGCDIWPEPFIDWYAGANACVSCRALENDYVALKEDWTTPTGLMFWCRNPTRDMTWRKIRRTAKVAYMSGVYDDNSGRRVWKYQRFDRLSDRYIELVIDLLTGEVLTDQDHPLSEQRK